MKANDKLFQDALAAVRTALNGGFLYFFAGAVPADADIALDMVNTHTQLAVLSVDNDGSTGLSFAAPVGPVLSKTGSEVWEGTIAFDGKEASETTLTATFFRFCPTGDDGRAAGGSGARVQGTVGNASSAADLKLTNPALTANGTNTVGTAIFNLTLSN